MQTPHPRVLIVLTTDVKVPLFSTIIPIQCDVTSQNDLDACSAQIRDEVGYINVLIANAGMTGPGLHTLRLRCTLSEFVKHARSSPMQEVSSVYELNCTAVYYSILVFLELLDDGNKSGYQGGKSQVIATASTASFLRDPRAGFAYTSSKAALMSMIKSMSTFCVPWGIRFNAFAAGRKCALPLLLCPNYIPLNFKF